MSLILARQTMDRIKFHLMVIPGVTIILVLTRNTLAGTITRVIKSPWNSTLRQKNLNFPKPNIPIKAIKCQLNSTKKINFIFVSP